MSVDGDEPLILVASGGKGEPRAGLPSGPFDPLEHHTFEIGLRAWVKAQTALSVGYVEQLYTFGDRGRAAQPRRQGPSRRFDRLSRADAHAGKSLRIAVRRRRLRAVVSIFPVGRLARRATRDHRRRDHAGAGGMGLAQDGETSRRARSPQGAIAAQFRSRRRTWDEEKTLDRYELLYEAGLVEEALRDGREAARARSKLPALGESMRYDHRRIFATAIARLRAKLKYRPVVFELMAGEFTLTALATHGRGDLRTPPAQAEFPPAGRERRAGRIDRRNVDCDRRASRRAVPLSP